MQKDPSWVKNNWKAEPHHYNMTPSYIPPPLWSEAFGFGEL